MKTLLSAIVIAVMLVAESAYCQVSTTAGPEKGSSPVEIRSEATENRPEFDPKMTETVTISAEQKFVDKAAPQSPAPAAPPEPVEKPKSPKGARRSSSTRNSPFDFVTVLPEISQTVELSNTDVNRFICTDNIQDVVYSKEKGVVVKYSGKNAFVKFQIVLKRGEEV